MTQSWEEYAAGEFTIEHTEHGIFAVYAAGSPMGGSEGPFATDAEAIEYINDQITELNRLADERNAS